MWPNIFSWKWDFSYCGLIKTIWQHGSQFYFIFPEVTFSFSLQVTDLYLEKQHLLSSSESFGLGGCMDKEKGCPVLYVVRAIRRGRETEREREWERERETLHFFMGVTAHKFPCIHPFFKFSIVSYWQGLNEFKSRLVRVCACDASSWAFQQQPKPLPQKRA